MSLKSQRCPQFYRSPSCCTWIMSALIMRSLSGKSELAMCHWNLRGAPQFYRSPSCCTWIMSALFLVILRKMGFMDRGSSWEPYVIDHSLVWMCRDATGVCPCYWTPRPSYFSFLYINHSIIFNHRCLLGQNFVRIGKWFVQPFESEVSQKDNRYIFTNNTNISDKI